MTSPADSRAMRWWTDWWTRLKRPLTWLFFGLVAWLLYAQAREIHWDEVGASLTAIPLRNLVLAIALAMLGHGIYACYDLLSRRYVGFDLGTARVMVTTFVSYAFNLNLGALVGGLGFRYRLYSRQGLDDGQITRTIAFSMWTNWFGYLVLVGLLFLLLPTGVPADWPLAGAVQRLTGALLLALSIGYLVACGRARQRRWTIRGHRFALPSLRLALMQLLVACANWMVMGGIIWTLLDYRVDYAQLLSAVLIAAVAGVIVQIPAGLGVIEAVLVTLLGGEVPKSEILGTLLAYRAIYYLGPLLIALPVYAGLEARIGGEPAACRARPRP